jgi:hypothetical protein
MTTGAEVLTGINVSINFENGPAFVIPFTLDDPVYGQLGGAGLLASDSSLTVDYTARCTNISIRRGRDVLQDAYYAGQATVRILDPDGDFNPQNIDSPIFGYVTTGRKIRISHKLFYGVKYLFTGYISDYRYTFPQGQELGFVTITAFDAFKLFNTSAITTVTGAAAGDTTGDRIWQILDEIDWPADMREYRGSSSGLTTVQADDGSSRSALTAIRLAELSEYGAFFISPEGTAVFCDRYYLYAPGSFTWSFSNDPLIYGFPYQGIKFAFDDKLVYNSATITRAGGTAQTYTDSTSIDEYFLHSYTQDKLIMQTDANALDLAEAYVLAHKDNDIRINAITFDMLSIDWTTVDILQIDYFSVMDITNITQQDSMIQKVLQCQGIAHDITPTSWITTYTTMEPLITTTY